MRASAHREKAPAGAAEGGGVDGEGQPRRAVVLGPRHEHVGGVHADAAVAPRQQRRHRRLRARPRAHHPAVRRAVLQAARVRRLVVLGEVDGACAEAAAHRRRRLGDAARGRARAPRAVRRPLHLAQRFGGRAAHLEAALRQGDLDARGGAQRERLQEEDAAQRSAAVAVARRGARELEVGRAREDEFAADDVAVDQAEERRIDARAEQRLRRRRYG
eukprot:2986594-Pleurochrysis_carterae.AAC.1